LSTGGDGQKVAGPGKEKSEEKTQKRKQENGTFKVVMVKAGEKPDP